MDYVMRFRVFRSFKKSWTACTIKDHYPKFALTMDDLPTGQDGIQQVNIVDFLLYSRTK